MNINEIDKRVRNNQVITNVERAFYIRNHPEALAAFMIANNPGNVNFTLRKLGYNLTFEPKKEALIRQMQIIIDQKHENDFNEIVKNFKLDGKNLPEEFVNELLTQFSK